MNQRETMGCADCPVCHEELGEALTWTCECCETEIHGHCRAYLRGCARFSCAAAAASRHALHAYLRALGEVEIALGFAIAPLAGAGAFYGAVHAVSMEDGSVNHIALAVMFTAVVILGLMLTAPFRRQHERLREYTDIHQLLERKYLFDPAMSRRPGPTLLAVGAVTHSALAAVSAQVLIGAMGESLMLDFLVLYSTLGFLGLATVEFRGAVAAAELDQLASRCEAELAWLFATRSALQGLPDFGALDASVSAGQISQRIFLGQISLH